ncbi:hypothetical protein PV325_002777 [Microctonus aethiopoides]|nr:hypothetical protein PV325_002777 [Microctonus aethiopoides]
MKYSTSPSPSRCNSPSPTPLFHNFNSSLPTPITYKNNCIGAASKCYKYLRKLLKFDQMDFEFAMWQVIYLLISPQKVYRNFQNRKQTKLQFARDDPAFLVLLGCWLCISSIVFAVMTGLNFVQFVTNYHLRHDRSQDVEWGYAFDIHLNAFFPPLIILHMLQLFLYPSVDILHHTASILWALPIILILYIISLFAGFNISKNMIEFYHGRAIN